MTTPNDLETLRRDGLREVATIGAGHAATALSQLTDRRIMISVPNVRRVEYGELPALLNSFGDHVAIVSMRMLGDLTGRALLAFSEDDAGRLCDMILRRPLGPPRALGELEQSGLKEVGNIVCSAYLTALSNFMQMMLLPSVPSLTLGRTAHAIASTVDPQETDQQHGVLRGHGIPGRRSRGSPHRRLSADARPGVGSGNPRGHPARLTWPPPVRRMARWSRLSRAGSTRPILRPSATWPGSPAAAGRIPPPWTPRAAPWPCRPRHRRHGARSNVLRVVAATD